MNHSNSSVFISYSHKNSEWKSRLLAQLAVLERHYLLNVWHDEQIGGGEDWRRRIHQAMAEARVAVVLVCPDAMESDFMLREELPVLQRRAEQGELKVIPLICRACEWRKDPWLASLEARPRLSSGLKTLEELPDADRVLRALATEIAEFLGRSALAELPVRDGPLPSDHVYLEKFPLTRGPGLREEQLIGREQELALLDLAFAQPHTAIVSLVAWGGVGKSMLVQHWLQHLEREGWFGAGRVYAWSFFSQGTKEDRQASEDGFLAHALEWFGAKCEPTLSPWDKGRLLADAVAGEPTLLILDGIEPLQYPPGPMGGQLRAPGVQSLLKHLARRANTSENCGLCLVTTREPLTDLVDFERRPDAAWGSMLRVDLGNLTEQAGAALFHHAGAKRAGAAEIKPDDRELLAASREVDGHALTLNLLGRFLARAHGGDIRRRDLVKFEEADRNVQGGTTFKMLAAFENWFAKSGEFGSRQLAVLRMLGLFDRPADSGCLAALREPPVITGLTDPLFATRPDTNGRSAVQPILDEDWNTATSFLADFGLIVKQADDQVHFLDCHPLVREHFTDQLRNVQSAAHQSAHNRLYQFLLNSTEDKSEPTLDDLTPLYEAVAHGCQAGKFIDALTNILDRRIRRGNTRYTLRRLGAFDAELKALASFFNRTWDILMPGLSDEMQGWLLHETAFCLRAIGRLTESIIPLRTATEIAIVRNDWMSATIGTMTACELEMTLGNLVGAANQGEQSISFADQTGDLHTRSESRCACAEVHHNIGRLGLSLARFRVAQSLQQEEADRNALIRTAIPGRVPGFRHFDLLYSLPAFRYCDLLLSSAERLAWFIASRREESSGDVSAATKSVVSVALERCSEVEERTRKTLTWVVQDEVDILSEALDQLTLGRIALYRILIGAVSCNTHPPTAWRQAGHFLNAAVQRLRLAKQHDELPRGLLSRAWLRSWECDVSGARADLDDAWDIAERGPMRLHMADIHLYRARLFFHEKHYPWKSPADDLAAAEKLINDCGYHRRDEELTDAKSVILGGQ